MRVHNKFGCMVIVEPRAPLTHFQFNYFKGPPFQIFFENNIIYVQLTPFFLE
jgi:hypothetical protein